MNYLELLDWRRLVSELFAELRARPTDAHTAAWFRGQKDLLFRRHPQSPLPEAQRRSFRHLAYWPFNPAARVAAHFEPAEEAELTLPLSVQTDLPAKRIGWLNFRYAGHDCRLAALWLQGYAGGLFVPFGDATNGRETYGGGRYLLDTIKSAYLGADAASGSLILDFNYAYHPSCVYDPHWACPLAPTENRLPLPIHAGERLPAGDVGRASSQLIYSRPRLDGVRAGAVGQVGRNIDPLA
ncbi:MAG: DUF1684 domain-containing protein [Chloroflexota bacterium]|nr:DUF1684 domain-containing protein [Chloroflexota bacterium]